MIRTVIGLLPALGCAAVMFFCLRMASGHHGEAPTEPDPTQSEELARLRKEVAQLRAEVGLDRNEGFPTLAGR